MSTTVSTSPRRPRRWLRRLLWMAGIIVVLAAVLVALGPTILSMGLFRGTVLGSVNARVPVVIDARSLSLSWFGSQEIQGLSVRTKDGKKVADLAKVSLDQGLYDLVRHGDRIGAVTVDGGEVWTEGLKAVAQTAAATPPTPSPAAKGPPTLPAGIKISNLIVHSSGPAALTLASAEVSGAGDGPRKVDVAWQLALGNASGSGKVEATVEGLGSDWRGWNALGATAAVHLEDVPTEAAWSLAADFGAAGGLQGGGSLSGTIQAQMSREGALSATLTDCTGKNIWMTGEMLGGDRPALTTLNLSGKVAYDKGVIDVTGMDFACPVATAKANGRFALAALKGESPDAGGKVAVTADLARLAAMLPHTLSIQKGLVVKSGQIDGTVELALVDVPGSKNRTATLKAGVALSDLVAERNGKTFALVPIRLASQVEKTYGPAASAVPEDTWTMLKSLNVQSLELTGPFGTVTGHGRVESVILDANLDLTSATREVGQFIDLGEYSAQGKAVLHLESKGNVESGLSLTATGNLENVRLAIGQGRTWQEDKAALDVAGGVKFAKPAAGAADGAPSPSEITVDHLAYNGASADLSAAGKVTRGQAGWIYTGTASGKGAVAWLATIVETVVTGKAAEKIAPAPVAAANEAAGPTEWRQAVRQFIDGMRDPQTKTLPGRWTFTAQADGTETTAVNATVAVQLQDVVLGPPIQVASPLHVQNLVLSGKAVHTAGHPWTVNFKDVEVAAKEVSLKANGDMNISEDWRFGTLTGNLAADVQGDLAWVSGTLLKMGLWPKDFGAASGTAVVSVKADIGPTGPKTGEFSVTGRNIKVTLGPDRTVAEDNVAATGKLALSFDSASGAIAAVDVPEYRLTLSAGTLAGNASVAKKGAWVYTATVSGEGDSAALTRTVAGLTGAKGASGIGKWKIAGGKLTMDDNGLSVAGALAATNLVIGPFEKLSTPLAIAEVAVDGSASHKTGGPWHITAKNLQVKTPEMSLSANGAVGIPEDFAVTGLTGNFAAETKVDLAWLSGRLRELGYWPENYTVAGATCFDFIAATDAAGKRTATVMGHVYNLKAQLPGNRRVEEEGLILDASADLAVDAQGRISSVTVPKWNLKVALGDLQGQATMDNTENGWTYTVDATGEGLVAPLVHAIALATGAKPSSITGQWKIAKGKYGHNAAGQTVELQLSATNLVTETPDAKKTPIRLADVSVDASATMKKDGTVEVPLAKVVVPGLVAEVTGSARLPEKSEDRLTAKGSVKSLRADLAELANFLRPLGYLPADAKLTGSASLADTQVSTDAKGVVSAGGTLAASDLDIDLPASHLAIQEKAVKAPFSAAYDPEAKRVTVSFDGLESATASGTLHGSYTWAGADPAIDVQCDLVADGERLTRLIVNPYVADLALAGPVRLKLATAGPVKTGAAWDRMIAGQAGSGSLGIDKATYRGMAIEKASLAWRQADGQIQIGEAPGRPSQAALAGGIVRLGGRLDLRGDVAHYTIDQPITLVEGADLKSPGVKEHLQFGIPIFAEAKINSGRVTLAVDSLDLPLDKTTLAASAGRGRFQIDDLQADMGGAIGGLMALSSGQSLETAIRGGKTQTPLQRYGPVSLVLDKGVFSVPKHTLQLQQNLNLSLEGKVNLATEKVNFVAGMPMTVPFLQFFGASKQAAAAAAGQEIILPLTGTIGNLKYDEKTLAKRMAEEIIKNAGKGLIEQFLPGVTGTSGLPKIPGLKFP